MGEAMRSSTAGRELVRLGRRDGRLPMLPASVSGRLGEAQARRRPAAPAIAGPERPRRARSRIRTREIVASIIERAGGLRLDSRPCVRKSPRALMASAPHAIDVNDLVRQYPKGPRAVDSIDLYVEEGEIYGFLGPNGAGK